MLGKLLLLVFCSTLDISNLTVPENPKLLLNMLIASKSDRLAHGSFGSMQVIRLGLKKVSEPLQRTLSCQDVMTRKPMFFNLCTTGCKTKERVAG